MTARTLLRRLAPAALCFALAHAALGQSLACEKYTLPNGMKVILHEDRSIPRATINIWYRVGARDEPAGRSGFAHLFEHLMFMGTRRVPGNQFDVLMETNGGANNASTSLDRTNYFSWGPASMLPTLLWLDADRLEDMGLMMDQDKLDTQRGVVRNELRQTVENTPYGKAYEATYQLLYPAGHPYHNGVIGTHADLESAHVQNAKDFFASFYQPNNASIVIAGDFDSAAIRPLVADLFGTLPVGNVGPQASAPQPRLNRVIRSTTLDKVQLPAVGFCYHSPATFAEGDAEMDLLASVLADGNNSVLYKRLVVQDGLAADVSAFQDGGALGSVFRLSVLALPDADLSRIERVVDEELANLCRTGPDADDLDRRKRRTDMRLLNSVQSIESRADVLNTYEYYFGEPNSLERDRARYRSVSVASVKAWASAILRQDARLIQRVLPEEPQRTAAPRDTRPPDAPVVVFAPPAPETFRLDNGLTVQVFTQRSLPLVSMGLVLAPGTALDDPAQAGRAELLADMLDEGTTSMTGDAFASEVQGLGATFGAGASHESLSASMTVLRTGLDRGFALFAQAVTAPRLDAADWQRVHTLHIENLRQNDDDPSALAAKVSSRLLWGNANPYGTPVGGTVTTAGGLKLDDIRAAHTSLVVPGAATLIVAGDVSVDEVRALATAHLGAWRNPADATRALSNFGFARPTTPGVRVYVVDRPGAVQTTIQLRAPSVRFTDPTRVPLSLVTTALGGSFTSRLNQNLREKQKLAYGARSAAFTGPSLGAFTATAGVEAGKTGLALREFFRELAKMRSGDISTDEAAKVKALARDDTASSFGTLAGTVAQAAELAANRAPWTTIADDSAAINAADAASLNALARRAIDMDNAVLVLVGDRKLVLDQITDPALGLGLPTPIVVDAEGMPINTPPTGGP